MMRQKHKREDDDNGGKVEDAREDDDRDSIRNTVRVDDLDRAVVMLQLTAARLLIRMLARVVSHLTTSVYRDYVHTADGTSSW